MTPSSRRQLVDVKVTDALKRRYPSKHYVYVIEVTWDDNSNTVIFRRYSKFFDFQITLLELHPLEGGLKDPAARTIPFLPGKVLFRRSHIRDVAMKRLKPIDEYCKALLQLPLHISQSSHVLDFFETKPEDINPPENLTRKNKGETVNRRRVRRTKSLDIGEISGPISLEQYVAVADYNRTQPKELTVVAGQHLEVIEKHENGWWFVSDEEGERGWIPGVYLEKQDGTLENLVTKEAEPGKGEKYITSAKFVASNADEISFGLGVLVEVLQKNLEGWWRISYQGKEGWAPASYLDKPADVVLRKGNCNEHGVEIISSVHELKSHRRSLPSGTINAVGPSPSAVPALPNSASSSPKRQPVPNRHNKEYHSACLNSDSTVISKPSRVLPPPKRSSLKGPAALKPRVPPPLPPTFAEEPVYEYVTKAEFNASIPDGVSFRKDAKIEVIEKSPGGWWYIETDGVEGWAPSSYIEKQFKAKAKPPERPKPPKPVAKPEVVRSQPDVTRAKIPLGRSNSDSTSCEKFGSLAPALRPLPPVPKNASSASDSKAASSEETSAAASQDQVKPVGNNSNLDAKQLNGVGKKQFAASLAQAFQGDDAAAKETKKPAGSGVTKQRVTATHSSPSRTAQQPTAGPKLPAKPKFPTKKVAKVQPPKPPAPAGKKPVSRNKSTGSVKSNEETAKPPGQRLSGEVDFRSVLKSANRQERATPVKTDVKRPTAAPGRPTLPKQPGKLRTTTPPRPGSKPSINAASKPAVTNKSKPVGHVTPKPQANSVSSLKSKFQNSDNATQKPKPQIPATKPAKPSKPVHRRLQNGPSSNGNNSNNTPSDEKAVVVGRVEISQANPRISSQCYRGSPDGECDEGFIEGKTEKTQAGLNVYNNPDDDLSENEAQTEEKKFVAVADFQPLNPSEMGFSTGAVATLKETAKNDWWYVEILGQCGWVPSAYFQPCTPNSPDLETKTETPPESNKTVDDVIYSEIDDPSLVSNNPGAENDRFLAISDFEASDDTMINMAVGDVLELVEETDTGWWFVSVSFSSVSDKGAEGWVPEDHLQAL